MLWGSSGLVSCLACGACGWLVRAWCRHGARMRGDMIFNRAIPPPVQKWEKTPKRGISENSLCRGKCCISVGKTAFKRKLRRRRGAAAAQWETQGFLGRVSGFLCAEVFGSFFRRDLLEKFGKSYRVFQIGTELKICVMHNVFIGASLSFSHGLANGLPSEFH